MLVIVAMSIFIFLWFQLSWKLVLCNVLWAEWKGKSKRRRKFNLFSLCSLNLPEISNLFNQFFWVKKKENWALFHSARHLSQHYLASPISIHVRYIGHQCSKYLIQIKEGGEKGKLPQKDDTTRKMFVFSIKSSQQYPKYICYFLIVKNSSENWTSVVLSL